MWKSFLVILIAVSFIGGVSAQTNIQGQTVATNGQPLKAATVRAERQDGKAPVSSTKTDGKGRFAFAGLAAGTYKVDLLNKETLISTARVTTRAGKSAQVNFDLKQPAATADGSKQKKTKYAFVPSETGSHLGGHYEVVDENGKLAPNAQHLKKGDKKGLQDFQNNAVNPTGGG